MDYDATHAQVVQLFEYVRIVTVIAANESLLVHQMDANGAFLHGEIDTKVHFGQPTRLEEADKEGYVWRLLRAVYGLKRVSLIWGSKLKDDLQK